MEGKIVLRKFIVEGCGKTYKIEAPSHTQAQYRAARLYKEEAGRKEPVHFLACLFLTHVVEPKKQGRVSALGGLRLEEIK